MFKSCTQIVFLYTWGYKMKKLLFICLSTSLYNLNYAIDNTYNVTTNVTIINDSSCTLTDINHGANYQAQWEALIPTEIKPKTKSKGYTLKYQYSDSWSDDSDVATLSFRCNNEQYALRAVGKYDNDKKIPQTNMYISFTDVENNQIGYGTKYKKLKIKKITNAQHIEYPKTKYGIEISEYSPFIKKDHFNEAYIYIANN